MLYEVITFVGVVVGTYSSIFVAAPIVLDLDKEERKKNKVVADTKKVPATA